MGAGLIDDDLAAFLVGGNSILVATRNAALSPAATRACGFRVVSPDRCLVLLPRATSARVLNDIEDNRAIAISVSSPRDFRTVQLKGRACSIVEASAEDLLASEEQLRAFADCIAQFGHSRQKARNLWLFDSLAVTAEITQVFVQTPGPGAGAPLGATRGG